MITIQLTLLIICLFLSGFFSSSETALFSISKIKAVHLAKDGSRFDKLILTMKEDSHKLLTTILIGNNLVNIAASALATALAIDFFKSNAVGIATGIMTMLILVFGEIFPKSFATHNKVIVARIVILPIFWFSKLCSPLIFLLNFIPKLIGVLDKSPRVTEDELMTMVEVVEEDGEIKEQEKEFISNIFEFDDTSASEIMTPRADMFVIDMEQKLDIDEIINSGFTRIPIIQGTIDNVVGILNIKNLFSEFHKSCNLNAGNQQVDLEKIMSQPNFVPESKKLDSLLHQFKQLKNHIGIVIDEYGGVSGIVTLEDVVEELIGDISDETDALDPDIIKLKNEKWIVAGKTGINEINKYFNLSIPDSSDYDTFSGFVLEKLGRIPKTGETLKVDNFSATVKERDRNRIKNFILKKEQ